MEIDVHELIDTVEYDYPDFHLVMRCFRASIREGSPVLLEHEQAMWLTKKTLSSVRWLAADALLLKKILTMMYFQE